MSLLRIDVVALSLIWNKSIARFGLSNAASKTSKGAPPNAHATRASRRIATTLRIKVTTTHRRARCLRQMLRVAQQVFDNATFMMLGTLVRAHRVRTLLVSAKCPEAIERVFYGTTKVSIALEVSCGGCKITCVSL